MTAPADARAAAWAERLPRAGEPDWAAFAAEPTELRSAAVSALKARVDGLVRNEPPAATPVAEALVRAAADLPELLPLALRGRAVAAHFNGDQARAAADFERAAALYDADGRVVAAASVRRSLVDVLQMGGRSAEALACAATARPVLAAHGETRLLAQLLVNEGNVHTRLDDYPSAGRRYAEARELFVALGDPVGTAFADFNLAVVDMNGHRIDEAERRWRDARAGMDAAGMAMLVADCDYNLAYLQSRRGRFDLAIEGLERARRVYEANGKPSGLPLCDLDLAEIHLRLDARRDALEHAERACARFDALDMQYELARAEVLAGGAQARLGAPDAAQERFARAGARFERLGNASFARFVDIQRAALRVEAGDARSAADELTSAEATLRARGMPWLADLARLVQARARLALGEPRTALVLLGAGEPSDDELLTGLARRLEAEARAALGDAEGALSVLEQAVAAIEGAYAHVPAGDVRVAFFRDQHPAFVDLAFALIAASRPEDALLALERGRLRSLREAGDDGHRDARVATLRERLDWLLSRRLDAQLGFAGGSHELRGTTGTLDDAALAGEIASTRAELARATRRRGRAGALPGLGAADLVGARRGDELLLVYVVGPRGASVLVEHDEGDGPRLSAVPLPIDAAGLAALRDRHAFQVGRLQLGEAYRARHEGRVMAALDRLHAALGEALVEPVRARLPHAFAQGRPLVVVPYGVLHELPVHAFTVDGAPLAARHEVSYGLSAWQLARARGGAARTTERDVVWITGSGLDVLPEVARETGALAALYGEAARTLAPGALGARLRDAGIRGRILHIAGHGRFEAEHPRFSAVCLGDTFLLAQDLAAMTLDVDLVTLSGCETGRTLRVGGDELVGLSRALLGAGARAVLASRWPVDDADACAFMGHVYGRLAAGATARAAVTHAQRRLRDDARHPLSWAAFSLLGDPDVTAAAGSRAAARDPA